MTKGRGVIVGLIDTGVEARLPELQGVVLRGKQFAGGSGDGRTDKDTEKGGHGTAMAVSIAGQGGGSGLVGVAPEARILPLVGGSYYYTDRIRYAVDHGARVINISQSTASASCPPETQEAVTYAIERDVIIVASAGNRAIDKSTLSLPQNCAGVLVVGSLDADLNMWDKSTPGSTVMAAAPGVDVGAIGKAGIYAKGRRGTSYAAAFTSGLVALMRSRYPKMSGREVVQRMLYTARDVDTKGWDERSGYGALIPYSALTAKVPANAPNPVYERFDQLTKPSQASAKPATRTSNDSVAGQGHNALRTALIGVVGLILVVALIGFLYLRKIGTGAQ
ncbi:S8 family serine peptidase [Actinomadura sp. 9N407]|uniref:S8 family serine peptidase n=1 Tax=Actinomadura sp. 9N407 TaxID=3375154 RepID=UPI0037895920